MEIPAHQLIYLVYGRDEFYREALFSIASALLRSRDQARLRIVVYCDDPARFTHLPIIVEPISDQDLQEWAGDIGYNHRAKPCLLKRALPDAAKSALIDTDTFFLQAPEQLFDRIDSGWLLVDEILGAWSEVDGGLFYRKLNPLLLDHWLGPSLKLVNSGVIGLTRDSAPLLDKTIELIDRLYLPSGRTFTIEQVALGVAAHERYQLRAQGRVFKHYWSRKQIFRSKADTFLELHGDDLLGAEARSDLPLVRAELLKPGAVSRLRYKLRLLCYSAEHRQFFLELLYGVHDYTNKIDRTSREVWWDKAISNWHAGHNSDDRELDMILGSEGLRRLLGDDYRRFADFAERRLGQHKAAQ